MRPLNTYYAQSRECKSSYRTPGIIGETSQAHSNDSDESVAAADAALNAYLAFFVDAAPALFGISSQGIFLDGAKEFFERHEERVRALIKSHLTEEKQKLINFLLSFADGCKLLLNALISLRDKNYEASLTYYKAARAGFRETSISIPTGLQISELLREVCINLATVAIPQMESRVEHEQMLSKQIDVLNAESSKLNEQISSLKEENRDSQDRYLSLVKAVARPFGDININNTNEVIARLEMSNSINQTIQNNAIQKILDDLEEVQGKIPRDHVEAIKVASEQARNEQDLAKKLEKFGKVLDAMDKVADAASNLVPYGRTAYGILRAIFSRN